VVYIYNGILYSLDKEQNSNICYNVDESWGHYAKGNKAVTKRQIMHGPTYRRYQSSQIHRDRSMLVAARGLEERRMENY